METIIRPIAHIKSDFTDKFGIPRQSGLVPELTARIVFEPEYRDPNALVGLEGYRPDWVETPGVVCLPPAALTGPMRWGFPAWSCRASRTATFW